MVDPKNLRTVQRLAQDTGIPQATIRQWIYDAPFNGFARCMIRPGRRIYVDLPVFTKWLEGCRGSAPRRARIPRPRKGEYGVLRAS